MSARKTELKKSMNKKPAKLGCRHERLILMEGVHYHCTRCGANVIGLQPEALAGLSTDIDVQLGRIKAEFFQLMTSINAAKAGF
jgi:hypothetical protein